MSHSEKRSSKYLSINTSYSQPFSVSGIKPLLRLEMVLVSQARWATKNSPQQYSYLQALCLKNQLQLKAYKGYISQFTRDNKRFLSFECSDCEMQLNRNNFSLKHCCLPLGEKLKAPGNLAAHLFTATTPPLHKPASSHLSRQPQIKLLRENDFNNL